jgi:hypothetical protein
MSWLVLAIMGRLQEADAILEQYRQVVYGVAAKLRKQKTQPLRALYRGLLLEPGGGGFVEPDLRMQSVSFSEDRDVACYFADPGVIMSGAVRAERPDVEGYILEYMPKRDDILWHYKWNPVGFLDVRDLARMHPLTAHDPEQFDYVFVTQKEVILRQFAPGVRLPVTPIAQCPEASELDRRFTPPHIL